VETGQLSLSALGDEIREAIADGFDPVRFQVDFYRRLAAPLACVLLPALALAFASSGPPSPSGGQMMVVAMLLTIAHALLSAGGAALGYGGVLPPRVAGWGPPVVLLLIGTLAGRNLSWPVGLRSRRGLEPREIPAG